MAQDYSSSPTDETGKVKGTKAPSGGSYDTDEAIAQKKCEENYHKSQGAGGLGGAAKRSKPGYKEGLVGACPPGGARKMKAPPAKPEAPGLSKLGE